MISRYFGFVLQICGIHALSGKKQPNIIVVLTDDQDLRMGSMRAMPFMTGKIMPQAANLSNFFIHTPICCPSRSTLLSGKYVHNIKMKSAVGGCMHMNSSRKDNPEFWEQSFINQLSKDHGYTTGLFGKMLNDMTTYGCDGKSGDVPGLDRSLAMCQTSFYNMGWANYTKNKDGSTSGSVVHTGKTPEEYSTSIVGNATLEWIKEVLSEGPDHKPFFAWVGPHAPHLPSTPPPYDVDPTVADISFLEDPMYDVLAADKHDPYPKQPEINPVDRTRVIQEFTDRMKSLVAVDDVVQQIVEYLESVGEWENTYFLYTSDHGYSLGQFRQDTYKMQVYDHNTRVPMIISGPGISKGVELPIITSMVDIAPTLLELAAGGNNPSAIPSYMDGMSFAPLLTKSAERPWKGAALVEYFSVFTKDAGGGPVPAEYSCDAPFSEEETLEYVSAIGYPADSELDEKGLPRLCHQPVNASVECWAQSQPISGQNCHYFDGPNNTYVAMRIIDGNDNLLYAEFADVTNPKAWDFAPEQLNFFELYNVSEDYFMMHNIYKDAPAALKQDLHKRLQAAIKCKGNQECNELLKPSASSTNLVEYV